LFGVVTSFWSKRVWFGFLKPFSLCEEAPKIDKTFHQKEKFSSFLIGSFSSTYCPRPFLIPPLVMKNFSRFIESPRIFHKKFHNFLEKLIPVSSNPHVSEKYSFKEKSIKMDP
jgi:hypothetical protein